MPIPNTVLTKEQFTELQKAITEVKGAVDKASDLAENAVQYIADLDAAAPTVDLINSFNNFLTLIESLNVSSNYTAIVSALNTHGITRGGDSAGSLSERLNSYLEAEDIKVSDDYYDLSLNSGYTITTPDFVGDAIVLLGGSTSYPDTVTPLTTGALSDGATVYTDSVVPGGFSGGTGPFIFSVEGTLPAGLGIIQNTGVITGTIPNSDSWDGDYSFTVVVRDSVGNHNRANYSMTVS
jgi:hypothetical protein